jgi:hypothetical protein
MGQATVIFAALRRMSMRISPTGAAGSGSCTGKNVGATAAALAYALAGGIFASRTQRRIGWSLIPRSSATDAIDTPGCDAAAIALALNSSLCSRERRRPATEVGLIVSTCLPRVQVDTSILCSYCAFKMTPPDD